MEGLEAKKYTQTSRKRFDPFALILSTAGIVVVFLAVGGVEKIGSFMDFRSLVVVFCGTLSILLFQFDFGSAFQSFLVTLNTFMGTPDKKLLGVLRELDETILSDGALFDIRDGDVLSGEILNDIVYMSKHGLLFEEIDAFVTSRLSDEYFKRQVSVSILNRGAIIAPALGLFGTVMGLIGVLQSLSDPSLIGPSMSLALMTTAYGAGIGSLVFTPLAGRLEHHNSIYLEVHKQLLSKVGVLLNRADRKLDKTIEPKTDVA
jgi:chemotaxis protein MotA